ncbi:dihydrofolate reductase family protein [Streptomyces sp. ISL-86]|uniref:dihydrofolate reductase family protein n=1 Tax=Streptomyces sp. ISL-86 TaxID=2819187 RepID=UPI001BEB3BCB|nr:dihydrofolate reductase family protein [Streptomyces sp. ISL-86]MBT2458849.1 dihydrofolate reductase family protein [Streptomyces sp. ISL-86]
MSDRTFRTATTIGVSLDGYIARPGGDIDWLTTRGAEAGETGYEEFMAGIDTLAMGRNTYEKVLTFGFWPYEGKRVTVLSTTLTTDDPRITVYRSLAELLTGLTEQHARAVYVDGGRIIQTFLREGLLDELTLTTAPVLLGSGLPLFGPLGGDVELTLCGVKALGAGFTQARYEVVPAASSDM